MFGKITAPLLLLVTTFFICGAARGVRAAGATLANENVRAEFGDRGLRTLTDAKTNRFVRVRGDGFSLRVNGEEFSDQDFAAPAVERSPEKVTFRFANSRWRLDVVYELRPGWGFIGKQIFLTRPPAERYHVSRVEVFRLDLEEPIAEMKIPGTYLPHLGEHARVRTGTKDYGAFLRLPHRRGIFLTVQNPFLNVHRQRNQISLSYEPEIDWHQNDGYFPADRGCLGLYQMSNDGPRVPPTMPFEWRLTASQRNAAAGLDVAEIDAFTDCVRAFLINPPKEPSRVAVGWTLNDYQIDVATPEGRAEYKRIVQTTADLGVTHLLYAPANSNLARRDDSADDWKWEYVLWLGLGQKLRRGEWDVRTGAIPTEVTEMIEYAKRKNVRLIAYVYPSLPFAGDASWLAPAGGPTATTATLASRAFQDRFTEMLVTFARRTGIGGYSFDYTFLHYPGRSAYAQWWGWRRVMENVRLELPEIVIDGRQSYHLHGPWSWLAGTYPHPTGNDEQPESFTPFPDLHFDRVSANRQRYVAYWYRNYMFAPTEILPGYMTHQTERSRNVARTLPDGRAVVEEQLALDAFRRRDWDYLGWKYSVLSSVGTAGWNNVVSMIPARDPEEFRNFSAADKRWFREWLDWATAHKELLRRTRNILGPPAVGKVDGTAAVAGDRGFVFLFNPNYRKMAVTFRLNESINLTTPGRYVVREIEPLAGRMLGKPNAGLWTFGDAVTLEMEGTSAKVFEIMPAPRHDTVLLFNAPGEVSLAGGVLRVRGVRGETGISQKLLIRTPVNQSVREVRVNNRPQKFTQQGEVIEVPVRFGGASFSRSQQINLTRLPNETPGVARWNGSLSIPRRIHEQLQRRRQAWPIEWAPEDYETTWLQPERLLLFVHMAEPSPRTTVKLMIGGKPIDLRRAYSSVREHAPSFVGWYADVSSLPAEESYSIELSITNHPAPEEFFQGLFFDNVETEYTDALESL